MRRLAIVLTASMALSACGSVHLHNAQRQTDAAAAKADYDASKFGDAIKAQRDLVASLERSEIAAFRRYTIAERDKKLLSLVQGSELLAEPATPSTGFIARFNKDVDDRLELLDGPPSARRDAHTTAFAAQNSLDRAVKDEAMQRRMLGNVLPALKKLPACDPTVAALESDMTSATLIKLVNHDSVVRLSAETWDEDLGTQTRLYGKVCSTMIKAKAALVASPPMEGKLLATAIAARDKAHQEVKNRADAAATAATELKSASAELAATSKQRAKDNKIRDYTCPAVSTETAAKDGQEKVTPTRLCKALADLNRMGGVGKKIIAEEKVARIGVILSAMSGVTPAAGEDGDVDDALALVAASTRLGHALHQYQHAASWPALEPLIIEKQLADAQLASANAQVSLAKDRLSYHDELVASTRAEIKLLGRARAVMGGYGTPKGKPGLVCSKADLVHCDSVEAILEAKRKIDGTPEERLAYRGMGLLSESYVARDRQRTAQVRLNASGYREALILAEESLASWKAILDTPVDQIKTYHAGGIKPAELAPLLQALGLFGIANGVN